MKQCDFCGRDIKLFERYFKSVEDRQCRLCFDCAVNFENLSSSSSVKRAKAFLWFNDVLQRGMKDDGLRDILNKSFTEAEKRIFK